MMMKMTTSATYPSLLQLLVALDSSARHVKNVHLLLSLEVFLLEDHAAYHVQLGSHHEDNLLARWLQRLTRLQLQDIHNARWLRLYDEG